MSDLKNKTFKRRDYMSGDGMLTSVWGPSMWHYLHTMSFNYPVKPTHIEKRQYRDFILSLQHILPCKYCRINLKNNFRALPLTLKSMESRDSFSRYIYRLHEVINKMLKKRSGLSFCDVRERYEHFRSRCTEDETDKRIFNLKKTKKLAKNSKSKSKSGERGCTTPLYGKKSKCIIKIVPKEEKCETFQIDKKCIRTRKNLRK
jgi:hypothetical protein